MKLFQCAVCDNILFFENTTCGKCGHRLAYLPESATLTPLDATPETETTGIYSALAKNVKGAPLKLCKNYAAGACNWAMPADEKEQTFCRSCRLSKVIPNLRDAGMVDAWQRLESAKRRLLYTLQGLGLPIESKIESPERGLSFEFMKDESPQQRVLTGHNEGVITINVAEADDPFREKLRKQLGEAYRTLLGHFRHEIGHYYWDRLVGSSTHLRAFREMFGDETASYEESVKRHYAKGPPPNWAETFVSAYATMHPWEDFAETWAHYLHMVDTLETARGYRIVARPVLAGDAQLKPAPKRLDFEDFDDLITAWVPLTLAVNSLNRSMGLNDAYPFVLSNAGVDKLRFVHDLVEESAARRTLR